MRVPSDSQEALEWPTSSQYRSSSARRRKVGKVLEQTAERSFKAAARSPGARLAVGKVGAVAGRVAQAGRAALALGKGSAAGGVAALGVGGTAAAVVVALGIGYAIGTGLRAAWRRMQPAERNYRKSLAFIAARRKFAQEHGREMTAEEVRAMGRGFLESLV